MIYSYIPRNYSDPTPAIVSYFKLHDALSASHTIPMTTIDLASIGLSMYSIEQIVTRFPFVKKTPSNTFWLDPAAFDEYLAEQRKKSKVIATILYFISFIFLICVPIFFLITQR